MREPKDNIRSILKRLKVPGNLQSLDPGSYIELEISPAWRINLDSSWLGHWPETYVDSLAYRWRISAEIYFAHSEAFTMVRYEDFLLDKKASVEKLAEKLGFNVVKDIAVHVDRQFQPRGERVTDYQEYYGENFQYIQKHCSVLACDLGYKD